MGRVVIVGGKNGELSSSRQSQPFNFIRCNLSMAGGVGRFSSLVISGTELRLGFLIHYPGLFILIDKV